MNVNYEEYQQNFGKNKFFKTLGWLFLIAGTLSFITIMISFITWNIKKENYVEQYVYSEFGTLYYEVNGEKVYVQSIYNTDNEKITINIPNNQVILMYINKVKINEGIFFDLDNTTDQSMLNPTFNIFISFFLIVMGVAYVLPNKELKEGEKPPINLLFLIYILMFLAGIVITVGQIKNAINYFNLKNENNITTATIYSKMYNIGAENNHYKPVSYYYVDNQKYIYVNDSYIDGNLENNIGNTFELYYNKNNPKEVCKKENPVNVLILIIGICFIVISFPFIFLKHNMDKIFQKAVSQQKNDWEI